MKTHDITDSMTGRAGEGDQGPDAAQLLAHPVIARLARTINRWPGTLAETAGPEVRRAAVALILRAGQSGALELLFIQRSEFAGDPWSGQVAFPGGRQEQVDDTLRETAIRETCEEVGVDLARDGIVLGMLDELHPRTPVLPPIVVRPYVAVVGQHAGLTLSGEVARAFWAPLDRLCDPLSSQVATVHVRGQAMQVPSVRHESYVIWGMTERIFRDFQRRLARSAQPR